MTAMKKLHDDIPLFNTECRLYEEFIIGERPGIFFERQEGIWNVFVEICLKVH